MLRITDWDKAYSNRDAVDDSAAYMEKWSTAASDWRAQMTEAGRLRSDLAYGTGERNKLDLFLPEAAPKGLAIYVHGGYWRSLDKSMWSHLSAGALAHGFAVAIPSYTVAPQASIAAITTEIARAISFAAGEVPGPIHLAGHSAGGHLVSRMVCSDTALDSQTLGRIVNVLSISGIHDLRPLMKTTMNDDIMLDEKEAASESPALLAPVENTILTAWVGGAELPELIRQNDLLANIWTGLGAQTRSIHDPGHNHFSVIDALTVPHSAITKAWLDM